MLGWLFGKKQKKAKSPQVKTPTGHRAAQQKQQSQSSSADDTLPMIRTFGEYHSTPRHDHSHHGDCHGHTHIDTGFDAGCDVSSSDCGGGDSGGGGCGD